MVGGFNRCVSALDDFGALTIFNRSGTVVRATIGCIVIGLVILLLLDFKLVKAVFYVLLAGATVKLGRNALWQIDAEKTAN